MTVDDHQHSQFARIDSQLSRLRREVDDKVDDAVVEDLRDDLRKLDDRLDDADRRTLELHESVEDLGQALGDRIDESVERLERRVRWLERYVRASTGAAVADLDGTAGLANLAARAARGLSLEEELLSDSKRVHLQHQVDALARWRSGHQQAVESTLAAVHAIARSEPSDSGRPGVEQQFERALAEVHEHRRTREQVADGADRARVQLVADDRRRADRGGAIADGRRAESELRTRIRTRLGEMVDRAEMPPVWFDTVLGPGPPAAAAPWLETGVDVIAYRVTYQITDPVVALGNAPDADASPRRVQWYRRLMTTLNHYH